MTDVSLDFCARFEPSLGDKIHTQNSTMSEPPSPTASPVTTTGTTSSAATVTTSEDSDVSFTDRDFSDDASDASQSPDRGAAHDRPSLCESTLQQLAHVLRTGGSPKTLVDSLQLDIAFWPRQPGKGEVLASDPVEVRTGDRQQTVSVSWDFSKGFAERLVQLQRVNSDDSFEMLAREALYRATRPLELCVRLPEIAGAAITTGRRSLSARERGEVWFNAYGDAAHGTCPGCDRMLSFEGPWHGAHLVSNANGGPTSVDNTTPSCGRCNDAMGSSNAPASWYRRRRWRGMGEGPTVVKLP